MVKFKLNHICKNLQPTTTYPFNVSNTVVEAVIGLKIWSASVPLWVNVPLRSRIGQEIVCLSRVNAKRVPCERTQSRGL